MTVLTSCRSLARTAWLRGGALWLMLAVVASGLPRWEIHSHEVAEHGHIHAGALAGHDEPLPSSGDEPGSLATHVHEGVTVSAALLVVEPPTLRADAPPAWTAAFKAAPPATAAGPPPQRPPIV